jgi:hypothetical protein
MVLRKSNISNNNATALVAAWQAKLHVLTSTLAANMGYGLPGGILALNNSVVVVAGGSVIMGNTAMNSAGGGVAASDNAVLVLSGGSRVVNNTSTKQAGGGVAGSGYSHVRIEGNSIVCDNKVLGGYGGGVAVGDRAELALVSGTVVCNNLGGSAIGGVLVADAAIATIRNTSISGNRAYGAAGGIGVSERGYVAVLESIISNNTVTQIDELQVGGGALAIRGSANVHLLNGTKLLNNKAVGLSGGAFALDQNASLTLAAGVLLSGNGIWVNTSSPYWVPPAGAVGVAAQASRLEIEEGVVGQDGMLTKCSSSIVLRRRPCGAGEFDGGDGSACLCCPPFTYSFDSNATLCQQCPANALCSADVVSPVVGYWHSSPRSLQMHRCPITGSCKEGGVCLTGHTGNLCGQCAYGFGTTAPLRCGRCMDPRLQLGLYMLVVGATVLFITVTVHFTWQDNKAGDKSLRATDLIKVLVQFLQYLVILGSISVPWPAFLVGMFTAATMVFGVGSGQALSLDCWLPQYLPSRLPLALQRQLSYFVGALVVAVACVVLMNLLHVCNQVWKACTHKLTRGRRQQPTPRLHFWSRLRVTLLVTAFYAYPTLVRGALSFFACLRIDDASKQPHPEYSISSHTMGYWVSAIQQECFAGWHQPWALGFGLPAVLLLCVGVPLGMFLFLWYSKAQTTDAAFREHYGFLFRNYTDSKPWWEAVWAVQTVLLTAISVFHFTIQAYYALLLMALVVLISGVAQTAARPYEQRLLHRLHLASTSCLFLVVWLSLALFSAPVDIDSVALGHAHIVVGAVMVVLVCSFVLWCLGTIVRVASPSLRDFASKSVAWLRDCTGGVGSCRRLMMPNPTVGQRGHTR